MPKGSVKIMLSYDYCHFEIALASDDEMTLEQIDAMRKDAQRLADKAVKQYQIAKKEAEKYPDLELSRKAKIIQENTPKSEWTDEQKAIVKKYEDHIFWLNRQYDYEDDWDEPEDY